MAGNKTKENDASVEAFLKSVKEPARREDCYAVAKMMAEATGSPARMWGKSMVGFGSYHYVYESGREGDWFIAGFSPRKNDLTLYIMSGFAGHDELMAKLGKYKTGKSCLYIKRLDDVDLKVLKRLIKASVAHMKKTYG